MGKSSYLPRHRLTFFSFSACCRVGSLSRAKLPDFSDSGVRRWLFLRGEPAHTERTAARRAGRVPGAGGGGPGAGPPPVSGAPRRLASPPPFFLPEEELPGARAPRSLPRGLASSAPFPFLRRPPAPCAPRLLCWRLGSDRGKDHFTQLACQGDLSPSWGPLILRRGSVCK